MLFNATDTVLQKMYLSKFRKNVIYIASPFDILFFKHGFHPACLVTLSHVDIEYFKSVILVRKVVTIKHYALIKVPADQQVG